MVSYSFWKLLDEFTKEDVEFAVGRVIADAEWDAFFRSSDEFPPDDELPTDGELPTETREHARAVLAAAFEAFTQERGEAGMHDDDSEFQLFFSLLEEHRDNSERRMLELLAIPDAWDRKVQLNAWNQALEDEALGLGTAREFLKHKKALATGIKVSKAQADDLALAMQSLEENFPVLFMGLTGKQHIID